ncbi:MAG: hypothetical protein V4519_01205 [Patescibacteria group bacterium]
MHPYEYNLSFSLVHPKKKLSELYNRISEVSGFYPRRIWTAGDKRKTQSGEDLEGTYKESYCYFALNNSLLKSSEIRLENSLEEVLEKLSVLKREFKEFVDEDGVLEITVGFYVDSNSAGIFHFELLRKFCDLGIGLTLDVYSSVNEMK